MFALLCSLDNLFNFVLDDKDRAASGLGKSEMMTNQTIQCDNYSKINEDELNHLVIKTR